MIVGGGTLQFTSATDASSVLTVYINVITHNQ